MKKIADDKLQYLILENFISFLLELEKMCLDFHYTTNALFCNAELKSHKKSHKFLLFEKSIATAIILREFRFFKIDFKLKTLLIFSNQLISKIEFLYANNTHSNFYQSNGSQFSFLNL